MIIQGEGGNLAGTRSATTPTMVTEGEIRGFAGAVDSSAQGGATADLQSGSDVGELKELIREIGQLLAMILQVLDALGESEGRGGAPSVAGGGSAPQDAGGGAPPAAEGSGAPGGAGGPEAANGSGAPQNPQGSGEGVDDILGELKQLLMAIGEALQQIIQKLGSSLQ